MNDEHIKELIASGMEKWWTEKMYAHAWNMSVLTYSSGDSITVLPNCFAISFTNIGDDLAFVNDMRIFPNTNPATGLGDSRSVSGHWLDLYVGNINLKFDGVGVNPLVEIVQLFYHNSLMPISKL